MVKGVGLDAGEYEVKAVELDGSFKRPKLVNVSVDRVTHLTAQAEDPEHATEEAEALRFAIKSAGMGKQNVTLGFPCREAILRRIHVPFTGTDRIRKMIKFEAESEIHSQSVDDMVVDFHVIEEVDEETEVLVAAVPKLGLRTTLDALQNAGVEPEKVDLDAMALYRVADWAGVLIPGGGEAEDAEEQLAASGRSRVLLDIGARAVRVLVFTDGRLVDIRAIPTGGDGIAESLVQSHNLSLDQAREAVLHCLRTGEDYDPQQGIPDDGDVEFALDDEEEGGTEPAAEAPADSAADSTEVVAVADVVRAAEVSAARDRLLGRLRREFMRFQIAVRGMETVEAAIVTGAASRVPGILDLVGEVFDVEPEPLQFLHLCSHNLSDEEVEDLEPRLAVAMGLALDSLGGIPGFNFRQEDLVYTRGFDRIKLPLAIACMLCLFWLCFHGLGLKKQLESHEVLIGRIVKDQSGQARGRAGARAGRYRFTDGYLRHMLSNNLIDLGRDSQGKPMLLNLETAEYEKLLANLSNPALPKYNRVQRAAAQMQKMLREEQKRGEYDPGFELDSGVAVLQELGALFLDVQAQLGRFYVVRIDLSLPHKLDSAGGRRLQMDIFYRGKALAWAGANDVFKRALEARASSPDSAFKKVESDKENPIPGEGDDQGCLFNYVIQLKDTVPVF